MPTYEYLCEKCGREFEKFQSMAEKPLKTCPKELCGLKSWGKGRVRKLIGAGAGLLFKGSGFYITDYRSEGYKEAAKKESSAASGSDSKSAAAGDAKSAPAKTETKPTPKPAKEAQ
ncbi:MAG: FmdB family zinc ribbon protein [Gammaproteobacteria bacterium]